MAGSFANAIPTAAKTGPAFRLGASMPTVGPDSGRSRRDKRADRESEDRRSTKRSQHGPRSDQVDYLLPTSEQGQSQHREEESSPRPSCCFLSQPPATCGAQLRTAMPTMKGTIWSTTTVRTSWLDRKRDALSQVRGGQDPVRGEGKCEATERRHDDLQGTGGDDVAPRHDHGLDSEGRSRASRRPAPRR